MDSGWIVARAAAGHAAGAEIQHARSVVVTVMGEG
jgi:hypothetical protein